MAEPGKFGSDRLAFLKKLEESKPSSRGPPAKTERYVLKNKNSRTKKTGSKIAALQAAALGGGAPLGGGPPPKPKPVGGVRPLAVAKPMSASSKPSSAASSTSTSPAGSTSASPVTSPKRRPPRKKLAMGAGLNINLGAMKPGARYVPKPKKSEDVNLESATLHRATLDRGSTSRKRKKRSRRTKSMAEFGIDDLEGPIEDEDDPDAPMVGGKRWSLMAPPSASGLIAPDLGSPIAEEDSGAEDEEPMDEDAKDTDAFVVAASMAIGSPRMRARSGSDVVLSVASPRASHAKNASEVPELPSSILHPKPQPIIETAKPLTVSQKAAAIAKATEKKGSPKKKVVSSEDTPQWKKDFRAASSRLEKRKSGTFDLGQGKVALAKAAVLSAKSPTPKASTAPATGLTGSTESLTDDERRLLSIHRCERSDPKGLREDIVFLEQVLDKTKSRLAQMERTEISAKLESISPVKLLKVLNGFCSKADKQQLEVIRNVLSDAAK